MINESNNINGLYPSLLKKNRLDEYINVLEYK